MRRVSPPEDDSISNSPYEAVFQALGVGMAIVERVSGGYRIVDYNRAAERAVGRNPESPMRAQGCMVDEVLSGIARVGLFSRIDEAIATRTKVELGALEYEPANGPHTVFSGSITPLEGARVLIAFENITGHVDSLPDEGESGHDGQLDSLAVRVAQELREPISSIKLAADLLVKDEAEKLPHPAGEYISHIRASVGSMKERIDDVLTLARVRGQNIVFREVNLNGLVRALVAERRLEIQSTGARIEVGRLPIVPGDPALLRQMFNNLLSNSLKFRRERVQPEIKIGSEPMPYDPREKRDRVRISVSDNGIGFSRDMARHIFHMFEKTEMRPTASSPGLGLGLCRLIVERHDGRIWATGTPGVGARFTIEFPRYESDG